MNFHYFLPKNNYTPFENIDNQSGLKLEINTKFVYDKWALA